MSEKPKQRAQRRKRSANNEGNTALKAHEKPTPLAKRDPKSNLRPWKPGQSGNPAGRPKIEPKVRKLARTFDKKMVAVLASIAEDKDVAPSERRKAAVALIEIGSGRAEFTQSVTGKDGQPLLGVAFNVGLGGSPGLRWDAQTAYRAMVTGSIDPDAAHPAFADRPALEAPAAEVTS